MNRLTTEWHRLTGGDAARTLSVELTGPAAWTTLAPLWRAVQTDWGLPAPAIAVNGRDGIGLWFALAEPAPAAQRAALARVLVARTLVTQPRQRVRIHPDPSARPDTADPLPPPVPRPHPDTGHWSAFVAPDLAPLFDDEPWLDLPPGDDAQADLLLRLTPVAHADFTRVLHALCATDPTETKAAKAAPAAPAPASPPAPAPGPQGSFTDPRSFLLAVMNDPTVPLAQRIEAAQALLRAR